jgi:cyclopropane fatty-acyl-phospholipid synthase-like methyltransferase
MNNTYQQEIVDYYNTTEASYTDGWDLNNSLALHYGYKDGRARTFTASLLRMNEVLMEMAGITAADHVLDAGCGIGGSSIYLATHTGCRCTGISLSPKQVEKAKRLARERKLDHLLHFETRSYSNTEYPDASFDVVWGLESICYADDKGAFVKEAFRLLKPGGRLIIADGMVTDFGNNNHPVIRKWLDGWKVNYLESPVRFQQFFTDAGFGGFEYRDITRYTRHSSKRLLLLYYGATAWKLWKKITFRYHWSPVQEANIKACRYQHRGMKKGLWGYGIVMGRKG